MFKRVHKKVWVFDAEWVPDPVAGRLLYKLPESMPAREVIERMWQEGGANEENPTPYLKTVVCRVVSISYSACRAMALAFLLGPVINCS